MLQKRTTQNKLLHDTSLIFSKCSLVLCSEHISHPLFTVSTVDGCRYTEHQGLVIKGYLNQKLNKVFKTILDLANENTPLF